MALVDELTNLGLCATKVEDPSILKRLEELHRPVGKIALYSCIDRINQALELAGRPERVSEGKYRSVFTPDMLTVPLVKFCGVKNFAPRDRKALELAIKRVKKKFVKGKVKPLSLEQAYERLMQDKSDHFAGLPTLGKKGDDVDALKRAKQCWVGKCPPPAVIGHRGKNTEVVRAVWMFPFEWHIVEAAFYYAVFDKVIKGKQSVYPVGPLSERRYTSRKYCSSEKYNTKFSIDYSGFDASLGTQMIGIAFDVITDMLDLTPSEQKVWERVQTYFATCPFLAPDGMVYKGRRGGVPSGSMFTQLVDSIDNATGIEYAMICEKQKDYRYMVYGDDSWSILRIGEAPQHFLARIRDHVEELGLHMNLEKTAYAVPSETIVFCGHYDIRRGRPLQDAIDKFAYPERPSEALHTRKGLCERLVAYMADADTNVFNAVYLSLYYNVSVDELTSRTNLTLMVDQVVKGHQNVRHLPGLLQVADLVPREASTLMKIRAAI